MQQEIHHPLFARFFDCFSHLIEREVGPLRDELTRGLEGRVLEVGCGNGINFAHYPATVEEVVAVEPEPYLRSKALDAAADAPVAVHVRPGVAGALGLPDGSFDAVVCSLVLCSVAAQRAAVEELRALLRPGGELRFLEHVRSQAPVKSALQRAVDSSRIWPGVSGGCHCSRRTVEVLQGAGFEIRQLRTVVLGPPWLLTNPHVLGRATVR